MKKSSSYQKLKDENIRLRRDIYTLLREKDVIKKWSCEVQWNLRFDLEDVIWAGDYKSPT